MRVRDVAPALLALSGCGALTAAKLVGETADVTRFRNEAAFARYTGAAPIPAWSGSTLWRFTPLPLRRSGSGAAEKPTTAGESPRVTRLPKHCAASSATCAAWRIGTSSPNTTTAHSPAHNSGLIAQKLPTVASRIRQRCKDLREQ